MDQDEALDYDRLKEAILAKYNINKETYQLNFRGAEVKEEESPKELYVRLRDLYHRWVQPQKHTKEEIGEMIIMEQFLCLVSPDLQVWIKERNPVLAAEAASVADIFVAAQRKTQQWTYGQWRAGKESSRLQRQPPPPKGSSAPAKRFSSDREFVGDRVVLPSITLLGPTLLVQ
ncbi:hypothetical protein ACEWY4_016128 [Coilia grayii]|uniref:SCAN box domain-containing protein n=1 Tax=Coilia grayii TaxID=363190 RepID=A0ABD1JQS8_9TELE